MRLQTVTLDDEAHNACEELAEAIFPHIMDRDKRDQTAHALQRFVHEAKRGPLA